MVASKASLSRASGSCARVARKPSDLQRENNSSLENPYAIGISDDLKKVAAHFSSIRVARRNNARSGARRGTRASVDQRAYTLR
jgi:hypothetical protein